VLFRSANTNGGNPNLCIEGAQALNEDLYGTAAVLPSFGPYACSPLTSPKTPATNLIVPNDPDPDSATVD
jgi:hypothetical protein